MDVVAPRWAGLEVPKKPVVACCRTPGPAGHLEIESRSCSTMTQDRLALAEWLTQQGVTPSGMEATGEVWKPLYNRVEANFTRLGVTAPHLK
jgi:transposase